MASIPLRSGIRATVFACLLLAAAGCASPDAALRSPGVTRAFAHVRGIT
jgi:hypothetical protein